MNKIISFFALLLFFVPYSVFAASLNLSPATLSRTVGNTFSVVVYVSSSEKSINAVAGTISFPTDLLEVVSVSKVNSVINLWVEEPTFSNTQGIVNFEGIALNPGYLGNQGNIITLTVRAKSVGLANMSFSSGSILANDGAGTNLLDKLSGARFSIQSKTPETIETVPSVVTTNTATLKITSTTHPDQTKWYSNNTPEFSWRLASNVIEVRTLVGSSPLGTPRVRYSPPVSNKKVDPLPDGTYYFSVQARTSEGWGDIARYRVNIDTKPPKPFSIIFPHGKNSLEPQPVILFNTTDDESGINKYDVKVGSGGPERIAAPATSNPYPLPQQHPGTHIVTVTASDEAGNITTASEEFTVESIEAPVITFYPEEIEVGDIIKIRGTSYPNSDILITINEKNEVLSEERTRSNGLGDWVVIGTKRLSPGVYTFTVRVTDARGAQSDTTAPLTIVVDSKFLTDLINLILNYLSATILVILLVIGMSVLGTYIWGHSFRVIRRLRDKDYGSEKIFEKTFNILRDDINEHITRLKAAKLKRKLTSEEVAFLENFKEELVEAKDILIKLMQDRSHPEQ